MDLKNIEIRLCRDCLDVTHEYEYMDLPGPMLPGIAGGDVILRYLDVDPDPHYSSGGGTCDGWGDACQRLAGDRFDVTVKYEEIWLSVERSHYPLCPACGEPIDYCQGHGPIGDPWGARILAMHDDDTHTECHPASDCRN